MDRKIEGKVNLISFKPRENSNLDMCIWQQLLQGKRRSNACIETDHPQLHFLRPVYLDRALNQGQKDLLVGCEVRIEN